MQQEKVSNQLGYDDIREKNHETRESLYIPKSKQPDFSFKIRTFHERHGQGKGKDYRTGYRALCGFSFHK